MKKPWFRTSRLTQRKLRRELKRRERRARRRPDWSQAKLVPPDNTDGAGYFTDNELREIAAAERAEAIDVALTLRMRALLRRVSPRRNHTVGKHGPSRRRTARRCARKRAAVARANTDEPPGPPEPLPRRGQGAQEVAS